MRSADYDDEQDDDQADEDDVQCARFMKTVVS